MMTTNNQDNTLLLNDSATTPKSNGDGMGLLIEDLATLPDNALLDEGILADIFKVTPRTIRRMVSRNELPPAIRMAGRSVWIAGRVVRHIHASAEQAEREAKKQFRRLSELTP